MGSHCIALVALLTLLQSGLAGPSTAEEVASKEGGYKVHLPRKPEQERVNFPNPDGVAKMVRLYAEDARKNNYHAAHTDFPAAYVKWLTAKGVVKQLQKEMTGAFQGKQEAEKEIMLGDHPGVEFTASFQLKGVPVTATGRIYVVGNRAYMLLVMGLTKDGPRAEEVRKFFDSFKLLPPAP